VRAVSFANWGLRSVDALVAFLAAHHPCVGDLDLRGNPRLTVYPASIKELRCLHTLNGQRVRPTTPMMVPSGEDGNDAEGGAHGLAATGGEAAGAGPGEGPGAGAGLGWGVDYDRSSIGTDSAKMLSLKGWGIRSLDAIVDFLIAHNPGIQAIDTTGNKIEGGSRAITPHTETHASARARD
jgi:hypothetical protein